MLKLIYITIFLLSLSVGSEETICKNEVCKVIVISDLNQSYGSTKYSKEVSLAVKKIIKISPDIVLTTGDHVAGQKRGLDYESMWDSFHKVVTIPLINNNIPLAVTPGNHDASAYSGFRVEREIYKKQWKNKFKAKLNYIDNENYPLQYSFYLDNILFISIDATTLSLSSLTKSWLQNTLEKYSSLFSYTVIFGHVPLYPFAEKVKNQALMDKDLEQLVQKYNVDLWISGHHHAYYPGRKDNTRFVSTSCLGSGARRLISRSHSSLSKKSFLYLEFYNSDLIRLDAFQAPKFDKIIRRVDLPEFIGENDNKIFRDDL
ncbi:MAG: hypothetical protein HOJ35_06215 [Bdellovibrionales bacterium]|nr:hypothetical protein [Bdellovibrionales bacterium]